MLKAEGLTKVYRGGTTALDGLDLEVRPGEVFGLLGPNGAGKTTTVHLFLNFIAPTAGRALVDGIEAAADPVAARRRLAYIPENVRLYDRLTGLENLNYFTTLATGAAPPDDEGLALLAGAGLPADAARRAASGYSKGMRQKVGIAIATAKRAGAILLDEPTSGLDPVAAGEFAGRVDELAARGLAVLMVTHDLPLAGRCGTRVGIMRRGRLVATLDAAGLGHDALERAYHDAWAAAEAS